MKRTGLENAKEESILKRGEFAWSNVIEVTKCMDREEATGPPHVCQLKSYGDF